MEKIDESFGTGNGWVECRLPCFRPGRQDCGHLLATVVAWSVSDNYERDCAWPVLVADEPKAWFRSAPRKSPESTASSAIRHAPRLAAGRVNMGETIMRSVDRIVLEPLNRESSAMDLGIFRVS